MIDGVGLWGSDYGYGGIWGRRVWFMIDGTGIWSFDLSLRGKSISQERKGKGTLGDTEKATHP